jgi:uncharacterized protein (TIRG00374 family)
VKKAIQTSVRAVLGIGLALWLILSVASANRVILGHTDLQTPLDIPLTTFITAESKPKHTQITDFAGIAIIASTGAGTWQSSADGQRFVSVGELAESAQVLVPAGGALRYVPAAEEEASISYRAWNGDVTQPLFSDKADLAFLKVLPVGKKPPIVHEALPIAESATPVGQPVLIPGTLNFGAEIAESILVFLLLAVSLYMVALGLGMYRWYILLSVQGIHLRPWDIVKLSMVGQFFNIAIPGAVSGDVVKMVYLRAHVEGKMAEGVLTIMLDRIVGILGLFVVAAAAVVASLGYLRQADPLIQAGAYVVGAGSVGGIIAVLCVQFREALQGLPGVQNIIDFGARVLPDGICETIARLIKGMDLYRERRGAIALCLLLSIGVHGLLACSITALGNGFRESNLGFRDYFLATQVANAVGAIPATPGGLGTRDATLAFFFKEAGGGAKAGIVPIFYSCIVAFYSVLGGGFFIFMRDAKRLPKIEDPPEEPPRSE